MSEENTSSLALLPNGFVDLLPPHAEAEARSIHTLMECFYSFGYERIKPPLLEFEDSLLARGPGERLSSETFRMMDPVSHRMLGVRADVTPQIARIAASRLGNEPRPIRLTYANDVLRIRAGQLRTERQFGQVGCELIGESSGLQGDIEICVLAVLGLKALEIKDITIDLTIPHFVTRLLDGVEAGARATIRKAVAQRDYDALLPLNEKIAQALSACGPAKASVEALKRLSLPSEIAADVAALDQVCKGLEAAFSALNIDDVSITVDVMEQAGFEYHKAFGFTLFSRHIHGELGRGGSYDVCFGASSQGETAKGFTLYMDTIRKLCPPEKRKSKVFIDAAQGWNIIREVQKQGWIVVRGCGGDEAVVPPDCTHRYVHGKIVEISTKS